MSVTYVSEGDNATPSYMNTLLAYVGGDQRNVKQFGATGDGTTDDTAAIQAAIDDVPDAGGIVFIPPGNYAITNLTVPYGTQIIGSGWRSTSLYCISGTSGVAITDVPGVAGQGSTGIWLSNFELRGRSEAGLDGIKLGYGGYGNDQLNFLGGLDRIVVRYFNGNGINIKCNVAELHDVYVDSCDYGLVTSGAVLRCYSGTFQNSTTREVQHACKDSIFVNLHLETELSGAGTVCFNVAAGGDRTYIDGLTCSVGTSKTPETIVNFATGVTGCAVRFVAMNLDNAGSSYTNLIYDTDRTTGDADIRKSELADSLQFDWYSQNSPAIRWSGTGAPAAALGDNGDFYFRQDGTGGNAIYLKASNTWSALV